MRVRLAESQKAIVRADPSKLEYASEYLQNDLYLVEQVFDKDHSVLKFASESVQRSIITNDPDNLQYASEAIRDNKDVALAAVEACDSAFYHVGEACKSDKDIVMCMLKKDNFLVSSLSIVTQEDRSQVLVQVKECGLMLKYASVALQADREVVLAAVTQNGLALEFASAELKADLDVALAASKQNNSVARFIGEIPTQYDRDKVMAIVKGAGIMLEYASAELKNDREIVMAAVKQDGRALRDANDAFSNDKAVVLAAVTQNGRALSMASESLKADKEVVLAAVTQDGGVLSSASESLKGDIEVVLAAVGESFFAISYASPEIKEDLRMQGGIRECMIQEAIKKCEIAKAEYSSITRPGGVVTLKLTADAASEDILVALSCLPNLECYEDKLHIIYSALDWHFIVASLAINMSDRLENLAGNHVKEARLLCDPVAKKKLDYHIDPVLLSQLSSKSGVEDFVQEQLLVLICKGKAPSLGGLDDFRDKFIVCLNKDYDLKHNVSKLLGIKSTVPGLFAPTPLARAVRDLTDADLMRLLINLESNNLISLKDAILSSNKPGRGKVRKQSLAL